MPDKPQREIRIGVGDIVVSATSNGSLEGFTIPDTLRPFVTRAVPHAVVRAHFGAWPEADWEERVFESEGVWSLHRNQGKYVVVLRAPGPKAPPYEVAVFDPDFLSGDVYVQADVSQQDALPYPLMYPLDELLTIHLLARGRGVLLHAFGIKEKGQGTIFAGVSGAGKSTLATLWERQAGVTLLSDDRVIVRQREGRFWVYGTPWCGDARVASPEAVPLERIFIIQHAAENRAVPLRPLDAASRLLARAFPTFWDAEGMAFTLDFLGKLCQAVPCYELGFVPDERVVNFVRAMG